jgi:hypothetical protein
MKLMAILLLAAFSTLAIAAEKDTREPLEALHGDTMGELMLCQISFKMATLNATAEGADYHTCINAAQPKTKPALKRALAAQAKKPTAVKAIKIYYAAWLASVRGITPGIDEVRLTYGARQTQNEQRLNELWAAVEMESGL